MIFALFFVSRFTGKERDAESGLDYFEARYYTSSTGRFMSPDDPKYSEKTNPQSWNLYSYVSNNPLSRTDPTGNNWFNVGGSYQWHDGSDWEDADGKSYHSDYNVLLRIQKTGKYTKDGAEIEKLTLLGDGEDDVIASGTGYTGEKGKLMTTPNGDYEINLNIRGTLSSDRAISVGGGAISNSVRSQEFKWLDRFIRTAISFTRRVIGASTEQI